ncbi:hypothetical protein OH492_24600 [Vibrio chagasii]|nr:hypothetical protein [Vibrio chagasii]
MFVRAQECLYISYVGRPIRIILSEYRRYWFLELIEYCHQNYCLSADQALPSDDSGINLTQAISFEHTTTCSAPAAFATQGDESHALATLKSGFQRLTVLVNAVVNSIARWMTTSAWRDLSVRTRFG